MGPTGKDNDVTVTTGPGKVTTRVILHWRTITLTDGRKVTVCEHRRPTEKGSP